MARFSAMKVAIAHPSAAAVERLRQLLQGEPDLEALWSAGTAEATLAGCRRGRPDLLLLDLSLPGMRGVELTRRLMQTSPCRILLLDAPGESRFSEVFEALGSGAIDVVPMPDEVTWSRPESWRGLLERIRTLRKLAGQGSAKSAFQERMTARVGAPGMTPVVAIGASTGGPKALEILLSRLPGDFPAAVVIVQHLDVQFMPGLATTLNRCSALPVKALTGETLLRSGEVLLAARDAHLLVDRARRLVWSDGWADRICRPSIDIFFESLAGQNGVSGCGVLLTGMGRDGAAGLLALRQAGFHTCAQDEASCVVYGMPKVAAQMGAAERILPLPAIADWLVETLKSGRAGARSTPMMPKTDLPHEP